METQSLEKFKEEMKGKILPISEAGDLPDIKNVEDEKFITDQVALNQHNIKVVEAFMRPKVKHADELHTMLCDDMKKLKEPYEWNIDVCKKIQSEAYAEKKRKEIEAKRKADEAARIKEEKEKARIRERAENHREKGREEKAISLEMEAERHFEIPKPVEVIKKTVKSEVGKTTMIREIEIEIENHYKVGKAIVDGILSANCMKLIESQIKKHISGFDQSDDIRDIPSKFFNIGLKIIRKWKPSTTSKIA